GERPEKANILSAIQVAAVGGETEFASTYAGYQALSDEEKQQRGSLRVVHTLEASQRSVTPDPTPQQLERWRNRPASTHPLVWTHRSGRRSLVIGIHASHVVGMGRDEGRALLRDLLDRTTARERVYRRPWPVGAPAIRDTPAVVPPPSPCDASSPRGLLRTPGSGDEPIR